MEKQGYHQFGGRGSFEIFYVDQMMIDDPVTIHTEMGWYWWPRFPGYLPDGDPTGPFLSSKMAYEDAREEWEEEEIQDEIQEEESYEAQKAEEQ